MVQPYGPAYTARGPLLMCHSRGFDVEQWGMIRRAVKLLGST